MEVWHQVLQQLINGISLGSIYALIALGYTMIYGIIKLINFAHGDIYMVGAYIGFFAITQAHLSVVPALLISLVVTGFLGMLVERLAYKPLRQAAHRLLDVFVGTTIATVVNVIRLPRSKRRDLCFFVRTRDLVPDRFSHISPTALFQLNYLYNDGAKICLMSEHAPAFFMLQMSGIRLSVPQIVMDGAAIYDANENRYLQVETIAPEDSAPVRARLEALGISYFTYTIHNDKTCIFHSGALREEEKLVYERMRSSPYRSYLEGEIYEAEEIVYFKVIATEKEIGEIEYSLRGVMPKGRMRRVVRPQAGREDLAALYIYAHTATMEQAGKRLMEMLRQDDETLKAVPVRLRGGYRSERDAIHLLHLVANAYEPVLLFGKRQDGEIVG